MRSGVTVSLAAAYLVAATASGQSTVPAVFVSNNGNLEGSVTAFTINPDGSPQFVNRIVTGTRASTSEPCAGCNAYEITLTPNGMFLATAHAAGDLDGITIFRVNANASMTQLLQIPYPTGDGTPLDAVWMDNQHLAFTRTDENPDQIVIARFNPAGPSLTELTWTGQGTNSVGYLAAHPTLPVLYVNDSAQKVVRAFSLNQITGELSLIDTEPCGAPFPLELAISPDGTKLYAAGGISDSSNKVIGMSIAGDGTLTLMPGSPFLSPGASPSNVWVSGDNGFLIVGHGTDATARTFTLDGAGVPTSTGNFFDVGLQGTLGDVRMLDDLLFVTDNSSAIDGLTGLYSFKVDVGGILVQNGPIVLTQGIAPRSLATWKPPPPPCPEDLSGDLIVGVPDLLMVINAWGPCLSQCPPSCEADVSGDCTVGTPDLLAIINAWGPCQ